MSPAAEEEAGVKTCLNPSCGKAFKPGHYGDKQRICGLVKCRRWYKVFWKQTRKPPRGFTPDVFARLVREAKDLTLRTVYVVARYSAVRKGELLGLTWDDVLDKQGAPRKSCALRGQWDDRRGFVVTKTSNARLIYFMKQARDAIGELAKATKDRQPFNRVFPFSEAFVWKWWKRTQKRLGIINQETGDGFRFHDIRHTALKETATKHGIERAADQAGHKNLNTTRIYTQQTPEEMVAILDGRRATGGKR